METKLEIRCPTCQKSSSFSPHHAYRPFCSERCRLIDLGSWANEDYKVPCTESNDWEKNQSEGK